MEDPISTPAQLDLRHSRASFRSNAPESNDPDKLCLALGRGEMLVVLEALRSNGQVELARDVEAILGHREQPLRDRWWAS